MKRTKAKSAILTLTLEATPEELAVLTKLVELSADDLKCRPAWRTALGVTLFDLAAVRRLARKLADQSPSAPV